ncbi:unnamed protein product [Linum tenue]|uniref:Cytokinin riboside 5'-monophosphate phosphoribohydrolase n=1 Tax=Linum tenue TaxID=586396 RepID=A0AAV0H1H1_9ROSI|nr:unnamed protein product [Linum tenue]
MLRAEMSFATVSNLGSLINLKKFHGRTAAAFQSSSGKWRFGVNFNCRESQPCRRRKRLLCKSEVDDFEERTSPHEIAELFECTSWTGAGPGLMDAATKGALQAGKPVAGFKIDKWQVLLSQKTRLADAAVRNKATDRTAVVALPGGIGTLDEMFEILALIQLERIGSELPVPFIVMNYDSFYKKLLEFLDDCEYWGTVSRGEVASLWKICENNSEALAYLADFYHLSPLD